MVKDIWFHGLMQWQSRLLLTTRAKISRSGLNGGGSSSSSPFSYVVRNLREITCQSSAHLHFALPITNLKLQYRISVNVSNGDLEIERLMDTCRLPPPSWWPAPGGWRWLVADICQHSSRCCVQQGSRGAQWTSKAPYQFGGRWWVENQAPGGGQGWRRGGGSRASRPRTVAQGIRDAACRYPLPLNWAAIVLGLNLRRLWALLGHD
jgi:hypothetical protein